MENKLVQYIHERTNLHIDQIASIIHMVKDTNQSNNIYLIVAIIIGFLLVIFVIYITRNDNYCNNCNNMSDKTIYPETKIIERYIVPERMMYSNNYLNYQQSQRISHNPQQNMNHNNILSYNDI